MTRDEVIFYIKELQKTYASMDKKVAEAVDIAIEALSAERVIRCKDCRHAIECHKSVQYTRFEPNTITIGYSPIEWCSRGERGGVDDENV